MAAPLTVVIRVPAEVLVLAVRYALVVRTASTAQVARAVRDQADELPEWVLLELEDVLTVWLHEAGRRDRFDVEPWRIALAAVRRARRASIGRS